MVADPRADRIYVAVTQLDKVAVIDTASLRVERTIGVGRDEAPGAQPTALAIDPDGSTLYVANSNEDAVAAISLTDRASAASALRKRTVYRPASLAALRRAARARHRRTPRLSRVRACGGPSRAQAARYQRRVLAALRLRGGARRRALRRQRPRRSARDRRRA
jgi:YVTN family beta-propeller protein